MGVFFFLTKSYKKRDFREIAKITVLWISGTNRTNQSPAHGGPKSRPRGPPDAAGQARTPTDTPERSRADDMPRGPTGPGVRIQKGARPACRPQGPSSGRAQWRTSRPLAEVRTQRHTTPTAQPGPSPGAAGHAKNTPMGRATPLPQGMAQGLGADAAAGQAAARGPDRPRTDYPKGDREPTSQTPKKARGRGPRMPMKRRTSAPRASPKAAHRPRREEARKRPRKPPETSTRPRGPIYAGAWKAPHKRPRRGPHGRRSGPWHRAKIGRNRPFRPGPGGVRNNRPPRVISLKTPGQAGVIPILRQKPFQHERPNRHALASSNHAR